MKTDLPATATFPTSRPGKKPGYPGIPITCNRNQLVAEHLEVRITEGGIFYPATPSTEGGEIYQGVGQV